MERRFSVGPHHVGPRLGPVEPNDETGPSHPASDSRAVLGPNQAINRDHPVISHQDIKTTGSDVSRTTPRNRLQGAKRTAWYRPT